MRSREDEKDLPGLTKETRTWRGDLRMGREDHGAFWGLGRGPPLRLCSDSLLRAGQINPKRSSLPVGISGQPGRSPLLLSLKKEKKWPWHHVTGRSRLPFRTALHGFRNSCTCNPPASTAPRFSLHDQAPALALISHNSATGLSWPASS